MASALLQKESTRAEYGSLKAPRPKPTPANWPDHLLKSIREHPKIKPLVGSSCIPEGSSLQNRNTPGPKWRRGVEAFDLPKLGIPLKIKIEPWPRTQWHTGQSPEACRLLNATLPASWFTEQHENKLKTSLLVQAKVQLWACGPGCEPQESRAPSSLALRHKSSVLSHPDLLCGWLSLFPSSVNYFLQRLSLGIILLIPQFSFWCRLCRLALLVHHNLLVFPHQTRIAVTQGKLMRTCGYTI